MPNLGSFSLFQGLGWSDRVTQVFQKKTCHSTRHIGCGTLRLAADNLSAQFGRYWFGWLQVKRVRWVPVRDGQPYSHTYIYFSIYTTKFNNYYLLFFFFFNQNLISQFNRSKTRYCHLQYNQHVGECFLSFHHIDHFFSC